MSKDSIKHLIEIAILRIENVDKHFYLTSHRIDAMNEFVLDLVSN